MNKTRRKELTCLANDIRMVKDKDDLDCVISTLETIIDDEETYYDNIPDNMKYGQRAYDSEMAIDSMKNALDILNDSYQEHADVKQMLSQAIEFIDEAKS